MHDIVRDFAIKLSKDEYMFMAKAGLGLRAWPSADTPGNLTRISIMYNDIHEVPDHELEYPKLQALLVQQNPSGLHVSTSLSVISRLKKLEDLHVTNFSGLDFKLQVLSGKTILRVSTNDATLDGSLGHAILSNRVPFLNSTSFDIKIGYARDILLEKSPPGSRILYLEGFN
ncbi:hypothetical protein Q3G72_007602 [Acer saccharum]|nr:hypothetical protein Q3G72_007602 [Acer saccharum]